MYPRKIFLIYAGQHGVKKYRYYILESQPDDVESKNVDELGLKFVHYTNSDIGKIIGGAYEVTEKSENTVGFSKKALPKFF